MISKIPKRPVGRPRADGKPHISREGIFRTAAELIAINGYAGTSLRMIADELGAQAPSILNIFKTKDRLLIDLVVHLSQFYLRFYSAMEKQGLDADVTLYRMIYEDSRTLAKESREVISIFYLPELRQPAFKEAQWQRQEMLTFYRRQLTRGIKTGKFRDCNTELRAEQVFQLTETNMIALHPDKLGRPESQARATAAFAMRGLLLRPQRLEAIARKADACGVGLEADV